MVRPDHLATNATDGNGLMKWEYEAGLKDFDVLCQFHCTSPLIKAKSIEKALAEFVTYPEFDSMFTVKDARDYYWQSHEGGLWPNYNLVKVPNSFELPHYYQETHALYAIHRGVFNHLGRRIGNRPLLAKVTELESYDINTEEDFRIVRTLGEALCRGSL
jgi:CMP-N-acetylneuraminic acid synthetase